MPSSPALRVLTLNLHTWQEPDQLAKFRAIADALVSERIDVACFQEVGELWNDGRGDPATHAGRIILSHLPPTWRMHSDWSHIGFGKWREGLAILSRLPFSRPDSAWISAETSPWTIHARRAVRVRLDLPSGTLDVVSAHLSWPENGFLDQFSRLADWVHAATPPPSLGTLVCGDFNVPVDSPSFAAVARRGDFAEQISRAAPALPPTRIDHVWLTANSPLRPLSAEPLFTPDRLGPVSDHPAYAVAFAPPPP